MTIDKFKKQLSRPNPDGRFLDKSTVRNLTREDLKKIRKAANTSMLKFANRHLSSHEFYAMIPQSRWYISTLDTNRIGLSVLSESKECGVCRYATFDFDRAKNITECSLSITRELKGYSVKFSVMELSRDRRPDLVFVEIEIPSKTHNGSKVYLYKREDGVVEVEFAGIDNQRSRTDSPQAIKDAKRYFKNIDFDILQTETKYQDKIFKVFQEFAIFEKIDDLLKK